MLIEVTQDDIDHGVKESCEHCPIAIAIGRLIPGNFLVQAFKRSIEIQDRKYDRPGQTFVKIETPFEASMFMQLFDSGMKMLPFNFNLEISTPLKEQHATRNL